MSDVLIASGVMLLVGRYLGSSGALVGAHGAPLRKMALSLGTACGAAGCFVVRRLHGNATRSVLPWRHLYSSGVMQQGVNIQVSVSSTLLFAHLYS